ncbi:hypothetical protein [Treponema sp. R6D11]
MADKKEFLGKGLRALATFWTGGLYPFLKPSKVAKDFHYGKMKKNLSKKLDEDLLKISEDFKKRNLTEELNESDQKLLARAHDTKKRLLEAAGNPETKMWQRNKILVEFHKDNKGTIGERKIFNAMLAANKKFGIRNMNIKRGMTMFGGMGGSLLAGLLLGGPLGMFVGGLVMIAGLACTYKVYRGGIEKLPLIGKHIPKIKRAFSNLNKKRKGEKIELTIDEVEKKGIKS